MHVFQELQTVDSPQPNFSIGIALVWFNVDFVHLIPLRNTKQLLNYLYKTRESGFLHK
jgi:hypothetical protein